MGKHITTEDFITRALNVHGNKYDYSLTEYISSTHPIKITCPKHGVFEQNPRVHLLGCGCQKCANKDKSVKKAIDTEEFIRRAKELHGERYDYSKTTYVRSNQNIVVIDNYDGREFITTPNRHLKKNRNTGKNKHKKGAPSLTKEEFIKRAILVHGNIYDYSKVVYVNINTKVIIGCKVHGYFEQTPACHLKGGCRKCAMERNIEKRKIDTEKYVQRANQMHKWKYDYSLTVYKSMSDKIKIICHEKDKCGTEHGIFEQEAGSHVRGCGCPKCASIHSSEKQRKKVEQFIAEAKNVHGEKYDYSKVEYKRNDIPVVITCIKHGDFLCCPKWHLHGNGCPKCNESKLEREIRLFLEHNNIKYVYQKRSRWLGLQSIDFYLPDYSIGIECQGIQHYKPVDFSGHDTKLANDNLKKIQRLDALKRKLCSENGVKLLYYGPHDESCIGNTDLLLEIIKGGP